MNNKYNLPIYDEWVWGKEFLLSGSKVTDQYTFKILNPKKGKDGCLSLQYHNEKSETWFCIKGIAWALIIVNNKVCTRIMRPGDIQNLDTGVIHRIMSVTDDCMISEASTPDRHAADKSVTKDVIRLHCVHGRECISSDIISKETLAESIKYTEEAINLIENNKFPEEINSDYLKDYGACFINL